VERNPKETRACRTVVGLAVAVLGIGGCAVGTHPQAAKLTSSAIRAHSSPAPVARSGSEVAAKSGSSTRPGVLTKRRVRIALMSGRRMTFTLPAMPLGTTKSITTGVNLEIWAAQRSAGAVTVVFALDDVSAGDLSENTEDLNDLTDALSPDNDSNYPAGGEENVGLFDPANLTEYQTFCQVGSDGNLFACPDSDDIVELQQNGARQYFADVHVRLWRGPTTTSMLLMVRKGCDSQRWGWAYGPTVGPSNTPLLDLMNTSTLDVSLWAR
jgi:hypothetical protein